MGFRGSERDRERRSISSGWVLVLTLLIACTDGAARAPEGLPASPVERTGVSAGEVARVESGMRPVEVRAILGRPARRTESLAEGYAWPEPKDVCWYYPSREESREYQVCFIQWRVVTRGSYVVTGGEAT